MFAESIRFLAFSFMADILFRLDMKHNFMVMAGYVVFRGASLWSEFQNTRSALQEQSNYILGGFISATSRNMSDLDEFDKKMHPRKGGK
jgi:hypothetical protein